MIILNYTISHEKFHLIEVNAIIRDNMTHFYNVKYLSIIVSGFKDTHVTYMV